MGAEKLLFYIFAVLMLASATAVITVRNPVRAVLFLVMTFVTAAILWMMLEAEFLALTLVLVYVGAVMVLFLFVVMMLDINLSRMRSGFIKFLPIGAAVAILMLVLLVMMVGPEHFGLDIKAEPPRHGPEYSNVKELGSILYTVYVYPFEIAAVILLVAIVAAIALTLRHRPQTKYQNPDTQVTVKREDRVRVVKMPPEQRK